MHEIWELLVLFIVGPNNGCDVGWFGDKCLAKCHCNETRCSAHGDCTYDNLCATGYFGPTCQYLNLAATIPNTPFFLTDYKKETCNPDWKSDTLFFDFFTRIRFYWLRLLVKRNENSTVVELKLNNQTGSCINQRIMSNIPRTLDIFCDINGLVNNLTIKGTLVQHICSLEIGAGRNAALYQTVWQSSTEHSQSTHDAILAVDGNTYSCSKTKLESGGSEWSVTFDFPFILYRVRIYNSDKFPKRLSGFLLTTYDEDSQLVETFQALSNFSSIRADIQMFSNLPVIKLRIKSGPTAQPDGILNLCEVEAYGAPICPDGYYGLYCRNICSCSLGQYCDSGTGGCSRGCPTGYYGFQCKMPCHENCHKGACHTRTGRCYTCNPGYIGGRCTQSCSNGTYGDNCILPCPINCMDELCHPQSGVCYKCQGNFSGDECTDCQIGYYGLLCSNLCPENCENQECDNDTGNCLKCQLPYTGEKCEDIYTSLRLYMIAGVLSLLLLLLVLSMLKSIPEEERSVSQSLSEEGQGLTESSV